MASPAPATSGDFSDLKSALTSAFSTPPAEAAPAETSAEPTSTDPGSTPEPATASATEPATPAGSTPPESAQPAPTSTSPFDYWKSRYGGDPNKAADEALALEQRHIQTLKELEELKARATQPPPVQTPPQTAPAHPVQPTEPSQTDDPIAPYVEADRECASLVASWKAHHERIQAISAELPTIRQEIAYRERRLQDVANSDPLEADDLKRQLEPLRLQYERLQTEAARRESEKHLLDSRYSEREQAIRSAVNSQVTQEREAVEQQQKIAADAKDYAQSFKTTFDQLFDAPDAGFDKEDRADLFQRAMAHAYLNPTVEANVAVKDFLASEQKRLARYEDIHHRKKSREYAQAKNADVDANAVGSQNASTATPANPKPMDWDDYLSQLRNQTRRNLATGRR